MGDRTKRIFISDIHMGDERSLTGSHPYCWFDKNIPFLADFLDKQLHSPDVKEVVILGDLFDQWIIPSNAAPLTSFADICSNPANKPIIDNLKALAASPEVKLAYVPGNHDMAMDPTGISTTKQFMENTFPGIRFFCKNTFPWGVFNVAPLVAEHGNRYCLFNAPDTWTRPGDFLPLGYFISRMVAFKAATTGHSQDPHAILVHFLKDLILQPNFVLDMFQAISQDAGLSPEDTISLSGVPGYTDMTVDEIGKLFSRLTSEWEKVPGNINVPSAIMGDLEKLSHAASSTYFDPSSHINVVIFGHTHVPTMVKHYEYNANDPEKTTCRAIYANSGTWIDSAGEGGSYVETEDVQDEKRLYVRVMRYPGETVIEDYAGFIET